MAPAAVAPSAQGELALECHPIATEFVDPISYLLKNEPAVAPFGICKVRRRSHRLPSGPR
jgi:hypothetical protein